ncbi:MAG: hypothetical protein F7C35_00760 [Desulfurococcales archaeon]|nr:hypothetical protein [Desulfurococcales archaeon]
MAEGSSLSGACRELLRLDEWVLDFLEDTLVDSIRSYMRMEEEHVRLADKMGSGLRELEKVLKKLPEDLTGYLVGIYGADVGVNLGVLLLEPFDKVFEVVVNECTGDDIGDPRRAARVRRLVLQANLEVLASMKRLAYLVEGIAGPGGRGPHFSLGP